MNGLSERVDLIIRVPSSLMTIDNSGASADLQVPTKGLEDELLLEEDELDGELDDELEGAELEDAELDDAGDDLPLVVPPPELSDLLHPAKSREKIKASPKQAWDERALFITYLLRGVG